MVHIRRIFLAVSAIGLFLSVACTQDCFIAPVERSRFQRVTSYDTLQAFLAECSTDKGIIVEPIARTKLGRNVSVVKLSSSRFGADTGRLRVLLFAQQHGDEPSGMEALTMLLAQITSGMCRDILDSLDLLVVPQMNPDGAALGQRLTADRIDLNRNHLLLSSPETKGLHDLFNEWQPHVTMDIHEYDALSRRWSDSGFIKAGDVQIGMLTNLNTPHTLRSFQHEVVFPFIAEQMRRLGFSFHEYIVGSPGTRIRHSTTEINDGRQSFGILNTLAFLQEGRKWKSLDDSLKRRAHAQLACIQALLRVCSERAGQIRALVSKERSRLVGAPGQQVILRMEHVAGSNKLAIPVFNLRTNKDTLWTITPYHGIVRPRLSVSLPHAYLVPKQCTSLLDLLRRHHVSMETLSSDNSVRVETYSVDSMSIEDIEETNVRRLRVDRKEISTTLHAGDVLVPTAQWRSTLAAIILEPESAWGVTGYPEFKAMLVKPGPYPIIRIP